MKFEVGMYVRTENGVIEKVNRIYDRHTTDNIVVWLNGYGDGKSVFIDNFEEIKYQSINARGFIKKEPSFNIIDLIEVGDYVNGYKVYYCYCADEDTTGLFIDTETKRVWLDKPSQIKSIVTKEQFESMQYRVGSEE